MNFDPLGKGRSATALQTPAQIAPRDTLPPQHLSLGHMAEGKVTHGHPFQ